MKSAVLSTNMSVFILKTGRKKSYFHWVSARYWMSISPSNSLNAAARCLNSFQAAMHIAVHGGLDVYMSRDRLQGFDIRSAAAIMVR